MRPRIYRQYSDIEKTTAVAILKATGGNLHEAGRLTDIPPATLRRWKLGDGYHPVVEMSIEEQQRLIADRLEGIIHRLLDVIPGKEEDATLQQTMTSVAIAIDKMRLMREQPTQITQREQGINATDLLKRLKAALPPPEPAPRITMAAGDEGRLGLPAPSA